MEEKKLQFDKTRIRELHNLVKILILFLHILGFICILSAGVYRSHATPAFYEFCVAAGFCTTFTLLIASLTHLKDMVEKIPWVMIELIYSAVWTIFLFCVACALAYGSANYTGLSAWGAASFFAFVSTGVYGYNTFLYWKNMTIKPIVMEPTANPS